jgi:small GTP-binding protein
MARTKKNPRLDPKNEIAAFIERVTDGGLAATPAQMRKLRSKLNQMTAYHPRVGVFGKTGAGKSSLCNALFGQRIAKVSNVKACTREPQQVLVNLTPDGAGMTLIDVPGVGESEDRDVEYHALYQSLLPELDLVLWVLKGDDRAFSIDERFYKEVVLPVVKATGVPIIFVLNQVDKIEPFREWDEEACLPGKEQARNIAAKVKDVKQVFKTARKLPVVVPVAADQGYRLVELVNRIVEELPDEKKYGFAKEVCDEHVSDATVASVKTGFWNSVKQIAADIFVEVAPRLIEKGVKWLLKNLPRMVS